MQKKLWLTILTILLVIAVAACGRNSNDPVPETDEPVETVPYLQPPPPPPQEPEEPNEPETPEEPDDTTFPILTANIIFTNITPEEVTGLSSVNEIDYLSARIYVQSGGEYVDEMEEAFSWRRERDGGMMITTDEPLYDFEVLWIFVDFVDSEDDDEYYFVYEVIDTYVSVGELLPDTPLFLRWFITTGGVFPCTAIAFTDQDGQRHLLALIENRMDGDPWFFLTPFEDGVPVAF